VGVFGVVEQQGAGDGVQDRVGGAAGVAVLQPGVVGDADSGQQRDLSYVELKLPTAAAFVVLAVEALWLRRVLRAGRYPAAS